MFSKWSFPRPEFLDRIFQEAGMGKSQQIYSGFLKLPKLGQLNSSLRDQLIKHHRKHKAQISIHGRSWTVCMLHGAVRGSAVTSRAAEGAGAAVTSHTAQGDTTSSTLQLENTNCAGEGCSFCRHCLGRATSPLR